MPHDTIPVPLGLPEFQVLAYRAGEQGHRIWVEHVSTEQPCPRCRQGVGTWSEQRWRQAQDLPILGRPVWVEIRQRRFRCHGCGQRFWERFSSVSLRQRQTRRFQAPLVRSLRGTSVTQASEMNQVGYRVVQRLYLKVAQQRHPSTEPLPRRLGVDEYAPRKGHSSHTVVVALPPGAVFDLAEGRTQASLAGLLTRHPGAQRVRMAVLAMGEPFALALRAVCRRVRIVIDRFHVERHLLQALDTGRKRLPRHRKPGAKQLLKDCRHVLVTDPQRLPAELRAKREQGLAENPEVARAVQLVQALKRWYETSPTMEKARRRLDSWYQQVHQAGLPEFEEVVAMIKRWQTAILHYFRGWLTNGMTEGFNTKIKLIIRLGYGFSNFQHLRARILLECAHGP
jgi:transposase